MTTQSIALMLLGLAVVIGGAGKNALSAEETSAALTAEALNEIAQVEAEIDRIEAQTIERLAVPPDNQVQQIECSVSCCCTTSSSR